MAKIPVSKKHRYPANGTGASDEPSKMSGIVKPKELDKKVTKVHAKNKKKVT